MMKEAIRLTNKTAIALRRSAQQLRTMHFAAAVILSLALCILGVLLGFLWLPVVPIMMAVIVLMDCCIMAVSRSRYLSLLGQAICTEAAAREIRAGSHESRRREQAISDLMRVKEELAQMGTAPEKAESFPADRDAEEKKAETDAGAPHRRRRQNNLQLIRGEQAK